MLNITLPDKRSVKERKYVFDIIFGELLGLDYSIRVEESGEDYSLSLDNGNSIIFKDHFFSKFGKDLEYLNIENIPENVLFISNSYNPEEDIPVIYGDEEFQDVPDKNSGARKIICGIDVIASTFFMLTRWEEYVVKERDERHRFISEYSLAFRFGFLDRPVVNEYIEMIWNMLLKLGYSQPRRELSYQLIPTHDVDVPLFSMMGGFWYKIRYILIRELRKEKNLLNALYTLIYIFKATLADKGFWRDPYDTFEYLMDLSENYGAKSRFYFMSGGSASIDIPIYDVDRGFVEGLFEKIKERGHVIGFHPSSRTFDKPSMWKEEYKTLSNVSPLPVKSGRQHLLAFEVPHTWQIWEDNGLEEDMTMGYVDKSGFRCGICHSFSVYNILSQEKLHLKEKPLIAMEVSFVNYMKYSPERMEQAIFEYIDIIKKYKGDFVILWHNNNINKSQWRNYSYIYEKLMLSSREEK